MEFHYLKFNDVYEKKKNRLGMYITKNMDNVCISWESMCNTVELVLRNN